MEFLDQVVVVDQDTSGEVTVLSSSLGGDLVIQDLLSVVNLVDSMFDANMVEFSFFPRPLIYQPIYHRLQVLSMLVIMHVLMMQDVQNFLNHQETVHKITD